MQLVIKKDTKAFEEVYDRYSGKMINYFHRMLWKDKEKATDFMQDLFMKIIERPHMYDIKRPFKTWLYSIANNMCKNEYKKQEIRRDSHEEIKMNSPNQYQNDTTQSIDLQKFNEMLALELEKIDELQKTTFILRYKEECSIKEISEILGCSEGTVKSRLFYTLKKLTPKLQMFNPNFNEKAYEFKK
ncbi:RNA polymerase sigma factor [Bacteroidota bacterium]